MLVIGLTGGIGSGKTTVANLFQKLGASVIDTDEISHQLMLANGLAYDKVINSFGTSILDENKEINRKALGKIIFNSPDKKRQLEKLIHPLVWDEVNRQIESVVTPYVIVVVPLLFEGNSQQRFDRILVIDADASDQIQRVQQRDNRSAEEVNRIIHQQAPREARLSGADDIIINNIPLHELETIVSRLHQQYISLSR